MLRWLSARPRASLRACRCAGIARLPAGSVSEHGCDGGVGLCACIRPTGGLFDSATFSSFSATGNHSTLATSQVTSPACTNTGATITEDSTASVSHYVSFTYSAALTAQAYTFTAWYARGTGTRNVYVIIYSSAFSSSAAVGVLLSNCTINVNAGATGTFTSVSATVTAASNNYCKVALHYTGIIDTSVFLIPEIMSGTNNVYTGDGTSSIYAWGADFRAGSGP